MGWGGNGARKGVEKAAGAAGGAGASAGVQGQRQGCMCIWVRAVAAWCRGACRSCMVQDAGVQVQR